MTAQLMRFFKDDSGATAIEYGLLAALLGIGIIGTTAAVSGGIGNVFNEASNTLDD